MLHLGFKLKDIVSGVYHGLRLRGLVVVTLFHIPSQLQWLTDLLSRLFVFQVVPLEVCLSMKLD